VLRGFATSNDWTDDLAAATDWYTRLVGLQPYVERPGPTGGRPMSSTASATTRPSWA
jgi:hypothetical protein